MDIQKICAIGRSVIELEAQMITNLLPRINEQFAKACLLLHDCKGRIAVIGVGKSGHIAKKLAATFSSTGSPAFFIHPSEAKHGDMGMITTHDVLLILSNSGETEEIMALLPAIQRLNIPIISLTGRPHSKLAKAATINIDVSVEKEACPLKLAPTASTTAALVMGDALAMALLDHRGFTKEDFAISHPGGTLGKQLLLRVKEIMHQGNAVPIVKASATLQTALLEMTTKKLGMTSIVNEKNQLIGIFTDGDLRRAFDKNVDIQTTPIQTVMSTHPKTITEHVLAKEALTLMETYKITALIVIDEHQQPVGLLHIHDILQAGIL